MKNKNSIALFLVVVVVVATIILKGVFFTSDLFNIPTDISRNLFIYSLIATIGLFILLFYFSFIDAVSTIWLYLAFESVFFWDTIRYHSYSFQSILPLEIMLSEPPRVWWGQYPFLFVLSLSFFVIFFCRVYILNKRH